MKYIECPICKRFVGFTYVGQKVDKYFFAHDQANCECGNSNLINHARYYKALDAAVESLKERWEELFTETE
jgi:hypothetical protein